MLIRFKDWRRYASTNFARFRIFLSDNREQKVLLDIQVSGGVEGGETRTNFYCGFPFNLIEDV